MSPLQLRLRFLSFLSIAMDRQKAGFIMHTHKVRLSLMTIII